MATQTMAGPHFTKHATDEGSYWTSPLTEPALQGRLRSYAATQLKAASIGGDQEQGFESAFASLAYSYLKDKSPRLLDFIVGFQLVDRNEDNTKAVGVFGFKVGEQWLYAPVFFLNGDLKGHELLYIKKQDAFVPMKENWVNYLIARKPHTLGEGSPQTTPQLGGLWPNLNRLAHPPTGTKYGSDTPGKLLVADWAKPFLAFTAAAATVEPLAGKHYDRYFHKQAGLSERLDLHGFLGQSLGLLKTAFEKCYQCYPLIKKGFDRFYGPDFFAKAAQGLRGQLLIAYQEKEAEDSYLLPPPPRGNQARVRGRLRKPKKPITDLSIMPPEQDDKTEKAAVQILVYDSVAITENLPELDDAEREKLLKDTVLIKDKRDPHGPGTTKAYNTQVRMALLNPSETGLYEVLEKPGTFDKMLVVHNPHSGRGRESFSLVVRKSDPRNWKNTHRANLWAKSDDSSNRPDFEKYVEGLPDKSSLKKGGTYLALHANGSGTCPFQIRESYDDGLYSVHWLDDVSYQDRSPSYMVSNHPRDWESGYSSWDAKVYFNERHGVSLRSVNGELSIPADYKIIKISDPPKPKEPDDLLAGCGCMSPSEDQGGSVEQPIQPGNLADVQIMLYKQASHLSLLDVGGNEVWMKSSVGQERMSKRAALISMVREHGLSEQAARDIIKQAAQASLTGRAAAFLVKYADGYPGGNQLQPGPTAPAIPEPWYGSEQMGPGSVSSIYPQEEFVPIPGMDSNRTDPTIYDPFYQPDSQAMQVAQQASQSGQKEVFDTAMLSGMLKSVSQHTRVDKYIGDLMKALDRLGRILFLFYWHNEEFEDRYGKQDLPELEDSLRNAFEGLGDVTLFLQEKTVEGTTGINMGSGVGPPDQGEPDINESARN